MVTGVPKARVQPNISQLLAGVSAAATRSAQINKSISEAAQKLAADRQANTGSGDGSGSGAALESSS